MKIRMNNFIFGRYLPGNSLIHKMNPAAKMLIAFAYIIMVFFANNLITYVVMAATVLLFVLLSKCSFGYFIKGLMPMLWVIIFTVMIQVFFGSGGHVYFSWGIVKLTSYGILNAIVLTIRFMLIIAMSTVLTLTTSPLEISQGISALLKPLKRFNFPVETFSLMISISLRFVPTLTDETKLIMDAQRSRGVDFGDGGLIKRVKAFVPLLIPLFVSAFKHADDLSIAMEARGYQTNKERSHFHTFKWKPNDFVCMLLILVMAIVIFIYRS